MKYPPVCVGDRFERLLVLKQGPTIAYDRGGKRKGELRYQKTWECVCDCGAVRTVQEPHLKNGHTKSCGCLAAEINKEIHTTHGRYSDLRIPEFFVWKSMIQRCENKKCKDYPRYGGRGIKVHPQWVKSFETFISDVGRKPFDRYSLERKDNDGNYEPGNVKWANDFEQARNRRKPIQK